MSGVDVASIASHNGSPMQLDTRWYAMTSNVITSGKAYFTIYEAAAIARCSVVTLRRAIRAGRLAVCRPNGKHGKILIRPQDLERYIEGNRRIAIGECGGRAR
jgi:excisionase family DNA binding protein